MHMQNAQMTYATLRLLGIPLSAHIIPDQRQQASTASIDIPEQHELVCLPDVLQRPLHGDEQAELL